MTIKQKQKCHVIIHTASFAAAGAGAGLAQIPVSDSLVITPIQIAMTVALGSVFNLKLNQSSATSAIAASTATLIGRGVSQCLIGWIPIMGNITNAATASIVTEIIGWAIAKSFEVGGSNDDLNKIKKQRCKI